MTRENMSAAVDPVQQHQIISLAEVIRGIVQQEGSIEKDALTMILRKQYEGITDHRIEVSTNYALLSDWITKKGEDTYKPK